MPFFIQGAQGGVHGSSFSFDAYNSPKRLVGMGKSQLAPVHQEISFMEKRESECRSSQPKTCTLLSLWHHTKWRGTLILCASARATCQPKLLLLKILDEPRRSAGDYSSLFVAFNILCKRCDYIFLYKALASCLRESQISPSRLTWKSWCVYRGSPIGLCTKSEMDGLLVRFHYTLSPDVTFSTGRTHFLSITGSVDRN